MSSATAWTGSTTSRLFVSPPANCSTLLWPQRQRSCPRSSWRFGGQTVSSWQRNAVVLLERRWPVDNHRQGISGQDRTRTGGRASLSWTPDRQPVQLTKHWWNTVGSLSARYQPGSNVPYRLQTTEISVSIAMSFNFCVLFSCFDCLLLLCTLPRL